MVGESGRAEPLETGGLLIGFWAGDRVRVVVTAVIGPGSKARHEAGSFGPDQVWQQEAVARLYEESGRRHTYLGDWHNHPHGLPHPSRRDRRVAGLIARSPAARAPEPLMLIIGRVRSGQRRLAVHIWRDYLRRARVQMTSGPSKVVV